jgi:hypothetical protein
VDQNYQPLGGTAAAQRGCPTTAAGSAQFAADNPGLFHASAFAVHPYSQGLPPNQPTPNEPDYAELADLPTLERTLDKLQQVYGSSTQYPIYSTEFGYQTRPPDQERGVVTPQQAAYYLNWSEYMSWLDPRIRSYDQYLLVDGANGLFASALKFPNGTPKPGYYAYRMPIMIPSMINNNGQPVASPGQPIELWGDVRPSHYVRADTGKPQQVDIQFQPATGGPWTTIKTVTLTDPSGYFDIAQSFPSSGNVRTAWSYPHGPTIFSRTTTVVIG